MTAATPRDPMTARDRRPRCLLAMLGLDIHTKGIRTLATLLRDRGVEVVYLGEHQTAHGVVGAAIDEDVDAIGVSFSTAGYLHHVADLARARRDADAKGIALLVGGLIHPDDVGELERLGVDGVFGPGTTIDDVVRFLARQVDRVGAS